MGSNGNIDVIKKCKNRFPGVASMETLYGKLLALVQGRYGVTHTEVIGTVVRGRGRNHGRVRQAW